MKETCEINLTNQYFLDLFGILVRHGEAAMKQRNCIDSGADLRVKHWHFQPVPDPEHPKSMGIQASKHIHRTFLSSCQVGMETKNILKRTTNQSARVQFDRRSGTFRRGHAHAQARDLYYNLTTETGWWLSLPLWKMLELKSAGMMTFPIYPHMMGKSWSIHVPNHQPGNFHCDSLWMIKNWRTPRPWSVQTHAQIMLKWSWFQLDALRHFHTLGVAPCIALGHGQHGCSALFRFVSPWHNCLRYVGHQRH